MNNKDWRLQGQEKYLQDKVFIKKKYQKFNDKWEHDHCEFCWEKFSEENSNDLKIGFATLDNYRWICEKCFNDFKVHLNLKEL